MADIKVRDLADTSSIVLDNQIMVLTNDKKNQVQNISIQNLLTNVLSGDNDNVLEQGSDGKLYVENLENITGNLTNLTTINKTSLVDAVNEVNSNIGMLTELETTDKTNIVNALNELVGVTVDGANKNLSNLTPAGSNRLHALKGYLDEGELLTDAEGLADVISYAHSTFDLSKFNIVGNPTITSDGIASGFSTANKLYASISQLSDFDNWELITPIFTIPQNPSGTRAILFLVKNTWFGIRVEINTTSLIIRLTSTTVSDSDILNLTSFSCRAGASYQVKINFTGTEYIVYTRMVGDEWVEYGRASSSTKIVAGLDSCYIGSRADGNWAFDGDIALKYLLITADGAEIFTGYSTGEDTYTINGESVVIPYTLSKTGSKIVDSAYRDRVQSVYTELGYAPYYTLDEENGNFTLPMGEVYGMFLNKTTPYLIEHFEEGSEGYDVYSNGMCRQWGHINANTYNYFQITFIKQYLNTDYNVHITTTDSLGGYPESIQHRVVTACYKTATGFQRWGATRTTLSETDWIAYGRIF